MINGWFICALLPVVYASLLYIVLMKHKNTEQLDINRNTPGAELYLGLVAPVGVDLSTLTSHLNSSLARLNYRVHVVKLSDWLLRHFSSISKDNDFDKLMGLMKANGNYFPTLCGNRGSNLSG